MGQDFGMMKKRAFSCVKKPKINPVTEFIKLEVCCNGMNILSVELLRKGDIMTYEEAKVFLKDCNENQKEMFAIIGILTSLRVFKRLLEIGGKQNA